MDKLRFDIHKYKNYWACPKMFKKRYDREEPPKKPNGYHMVAGEFVQKFFEMYSNGWKAEGFDNNPVVIRGRMHRYWEALLRWNPVDWGHPMSRLNQPELLQECINTIYSNIEELDIYEGTESELKFEIKLKSGDELVAKIDFIKTRDDGGIEIIDGKNSQTIGKYVDNNQLLFYALMYRFKFGKLPDKLGFLYYRHRTIDYVPFTEEEVDNLWKDIIRTMVHIKQAKEFPATPSAKSCRFCDYLSECPEGTADMNSRKRGPKVAKDYTQEIASKDNDSGLCSFSMD